MIIQYRNRRTGLRRTFQLSEILEDSTANILMQYDANKDILIQSNISKSIMATLELYTGLKKAVILKEITEKEKILKWLIKHNIDDIDDVGRIMAEYYTRKDNLMKFVNKGIPFR